VPCIPTAFMMGAAVTVSALPSSKVNVTTVGFSAGVAAGAATAFVTAEAAADEEEEPDEEEGLGVVLDVGVGVMLDVGVGVVLAVGSGVVGVVGAVVVGSVGVVLGAVVGAVVVGAVVVGSGVVGVVAVGSGVVGSVVVGTVVLVVGGVVVSSACAGPASASAEVTAMIAAAEAIAISRRRRLFGDVPGVLFTGVPLCSSSGVAGSRVHQGCAAAQDTSLMGVRAWGIRETGVPTTANLHAGTRGGQSTAGIPAGPRRYSADARSR
jgi:hypothetical protein